MTILPQPGEAAGADHPPARSGTASAWAALILVLVLASCWIFSDQVLSGVIRTGIAALAWKRGETIRIGRLHFDSSGALRATDIEWFRGKGEHRSTFRCDTAMLDPASIRDLLLPRPGRDRLWIRELRLSKTRLLLDTRGQTSGKSGVMGAGSDAPGKMPRFALPSALLPGSLYAGPVEVVLIGDAGRFAVHDMWLDLPSRWTGRLAFGAAEAGLGAGYRAIPGGNTRAYWEPGSLRIGNLAMGEGLSLGELTLHLLPGRLDFGLRGTIGRGLIRGDGAVGGEKPLEVTLVGERLGIDALAGLIPGAAAASGTIDQARLSFRGDPSRPMEADGSVRLVGRNFRWEGRGWESLRLTAEMTGRNLTLSELALRQGDNELVAEGRSSLPADWHALLRAPFTANFRAALADAGSLASLFGPDVAALGGALYLDGSVRGADNKAEGYCNFSGIGTRFRRLTVDWVKGCLLFEGATTLIPYAEAAAGQDGISLSGSVGNSRPHAYKGQAEVSVKDVARRLGELGLPGSSAVGAGALSGSWKGEGDMTSHHGEFRARLTEWVSQWTKGGLSGTVVGSYAPDSLKLSRAEMIEDDLSLTLGLTATPQRLELTGISVVKSGSKKPLATGEIGLPLNLTDLWTGVAPVKTLAMDQPLRVTLQADGLRAEQLADLLGQPRTCSGKLEGWITAAGTPASPELNGSLRVRGFLPVEPAWESDVELALQTTAGETTCAWNQDNGTASLQAECSLPLKLGKNGGVLVADSTAKLRGSVHMRKLPLDGWVSLLAGSLSRPVKTITANGGTIISGTVGQPLLEGRMELKVGEATLFGSHQLRDLTLPLSFSAATATLQQGTGSYQGQPVSLSGTAEWSAREPAPRVFLKMAGTNLPVELAPDLRATAKADLTYTVSSSAQATLGGSLRLDPIRTDLRWRLVPVFCPPGLRVTPVQPSAAQEGAIRLDLNLTTLTNARVSGGPLVAVDLHLAGTGEDPRPEGRVIATNQTLRLPCGSFELPNATVSFGKEGARLSGTAFGISSLGLTSLGFGGSLEKPSAVIDAGTGTSADRIFASAMTARPSASAILQAPSWLRQNMLLPVPARSWSSQPGETDPAALGFYGTPWIWNSIPAPPEGSGEQHPR